MAFRWRADDGPIIVVFEASHPSSTKYKVVKVGPPLTKFSGPAHGKTCLKRLLSKRPKIGVQDQLSLNAGHKYSAILSTFIKLPFVIKIMFFSIYTDFTVARSAEFQKLVKCRCIRHFMYLHVYTSQSY